MSYEDNKTPFVKEFNGVKAPAGFHYMPNGKLMSDADHVALYGYLEQTITSFEIDTKDISNLGESRTFTIRGDENAVFSLEVYNQTSATYYNFKTKTWSSTKTKLRKKRVEDVYTGNIKFIAPGSSLDTYTITLFAETIHNIKTKHARFVDSRNADGSININKTKGSSSNILTRTLYQSGELNLRIACIAPSLYDTSTGTVNGATSSSNRIVLDAVSSESPRVGDLVSGTGIAASLSTLVTKINPDGDNVLEIEIDKADSATNDDTLTFTPPFNGFTPSDSGGTTGRVNIPTCSGANITSPFTLTIRPATGRTLNAFRVPTIDDLCVYTNVTFGSSALAIDGENTDSAAKFFRWPVTNIANLAEGMTLDPSRSGTGTNTTTPAKISKYTSTISSQQIVEGEYENEIEDITIEDFSIPGVDAYGNDVTTVDRNGRITAQVGNITFDTQQLDALKSDSNVKIYAHGAGGIKAMTGMDVSLSNVKITQTQVSTTTTAASAGLDISLTEVGNIAQGMVLRGVGIDRSSAAPTVVSKTAKSGGASVRVSASQNIESGQTLFFDGGTNEIVVTGTIEVSNFPLVTSQIYFDVESFVSAI